MNIRIILFGFLITTMGDIHGVCSSTRSITHNLVCDITLLLPRNGIGIIRAVYIALGIASSNIFILCDISLTILSYLLSKLCQVSWMPLLIKKGLANPFIK